MPNSNDANDPAMYEVQLEVQERLNKFIINYGKTPRDRINYGYLSSRIIGLKQIWSEFVDNHKTICSESSIEDRKSDPYFTTDLYGVCEESYYDIFGRITQKQLELSEATNPARMFQSTNDIPSVPSSGNQTVNMYQAHIPRLNVPTFSGLYADWTSFHDIYVAAVHSNNSIQPVHKLQYLKSLLKGDAELLLKHTQITAENYTTAWNTLKDRFENKRAMITTTLQQLFSQRNADESSSSIRKLLDTSRECTEALTAHGIDITSWDTILVYIISKHIPSTSLTLWEQSIARNTIPTYQQLLTFLEDRFRVLEFSGDKSHLQPSRRTSAKPQTFHTTSSSCRCCQRSQHPLKQCPKFLDMQPAQRINYVSSAKLCRNCFAYSHQTKDCNSTKICRVCNDKHNTLLHLENTIAHPSIVTNPSTSNAVQQSVADQSSPSQTNAYVSHPSKSTSIDCVLATALVTVTAFDGQTHSFRALLDNASQENFVSQNVLQFLGVKPKPTSMVINGIGQAQAPRPLGQVRFRFGSVHQQHFSMEIDAVVLPTLTHTLPSRRLVVDKRLVANLELADPFYGTPGRIDILLSASVFASITIPGLRKEESIATVALQTKLGWVLYGEAFVQTDSFQRTCYHTTTVDKVSSVLQEFWKVEEVPCADSLSLEDAKCEQIYASTHSRTPEGRYIVHLPFKTNPPPLGASRAKAVSRFLQTERKLTANPTLRSEYIKCMNEYITLGHMHKTTSPPDRNGLAATDNATAYTSFYLPHHAVVKEESTTTKVRVVFDASSKSINGKSLNECMLTGPVLQDNLFNLLLRFRFHRIVIKADIEKMYRQILVTKEHQSYQRIVWRDHPDKELEDFQLRTVTFGTAAAPYLAIKTIFQLADDESQHFPIGAAALRKDFYVDDLLSGADSVPEAIECQQQVVKILQRGGFQIRKWSSNHQEVTENIDQNARDICNPLDPTLKALGILWTPQLDVLSIKVSLADTQVTSKRILLSEVSKLFDPLGWIAPVIIPVKILLQTLWLAGLTWDEPLPPAILTEWNEFRHHLPKIEQIRIPRWIRTVRSTNIELHGFCDASEKAYAAVIYVRVQSSDTEWNLQLITAKTRVAPVKTLSLPRLELCGASLLAKLMVSIKETLQASTIYAWTDSEIVLAWLQGHPNRWKTFVGNRVSEIHTLLDAAVWNHVRSKDNPADCASRGVSPEQIIDQTIWWHGPKWLTQPESHWPKKKKNDIAPTTLECKTIHQSFIAVQTNESLIQVLNNCETLAKAIRVVAHLRKWRSKSCLQSSLFTVEDLNIANNLLIQHTQRSNFHKECQQLSNKNSIDNKSKLKSLNPFFDSNNIMRVGGRLKNADIPLDTRHPIILPHKARYTELLIEETHRRTSHGGVSLMLTLIRTKYWILNARNTIRFANHKCNICFRFRNPSSHQLMGDLPRPRVNISQPFTHTGLDYAGPISILMRRRPGRPQVFKGYICVFVCLATKAIHLEVVGDMTAQTFLAAFERFTARRGLPSNMYSDNGTYFVRASSDIERDMQHALRTYPQEAAKLSVSQAIQWHFIPPAAPHFGGLWEAGVKSMKYHLKRVLGNASCTYEELATTLCQIESCLNSRPLCPLSNDPDDFEVLTPGHFLIGRPLLARPQSSILETPINRLDYWKRVYQLTQRFWTQWQSEYFSRLQQRPKWVSETKNIKKGDLILLKEDNIPPLHWNLGRVVETHPGHDGLTRVVTIKTATSTLKRPIVKICALPSQ